MRVTFKKFNIVWLAVFIVFISTSRLFSQNETSSSDTTWIYDFLSVSDSSFQQRKLWAEYDSADIRETVLMISDQLGGGWQLGTKFWQQLNPQEQKTMEIRYSWDADLEQWDENFLYEYYYDQWGNDTLYLISYKYGSDEWTSAGRGRYVNSYNNQDQLIQVEIYNGFPGQESPVEKHEFSYDDAGNRILFIRYNYGTDWALSERYEMDYDGEGREVEKVSYYRLNDEWRKNDSIIHEYDTSGNNTVIESNVWNQEYGQYWMHYQHVMTYDLVGKMLTQVHQNRPQYGEPIATTLTEYVYNLSGKLDTTVISVLDDGSGLYVLTQKQFTRYGGEYNILCDSICAGETYAWEGESLQSGGTYRKEYLSAMGLDSIYILYLTENPTPSSFSIAGPSAVALEQEALYIAPPDESVEYHWTVENGEITFGWENDTLGIRWETSGTGEVNAWSINEYGCSSDSANLQIQIGGTGTIDLPVSGIRFYPLPVKDVLHVECSMDFPEIQILDLAGREMGVARGTTVDLSYLTTGTYVVRVKDTDGMLIASQIIIKE